MVKRESMREVLGRMTLSTGLASGIVVELVDMDVGMAVHAELLIASLKNKLRHVVLHFFLG